VARLLAPAAERGERPATVRLHEQARTLHRVLKRANRAELARLLRASPEAASDLRALRDEIDKLLSTV
jgi:hypothetical protein